MERMLLALVLIVALAPLAAAQGAFPVEKSVTWKTDGMEFSVEGRVHIGPRIDIASQRALVIRGIGEGATIVVSGSLELKAVTDGTNVLENLTIELAPECRSLHLDNLSWKGGAGIRTAEEAPTSAKVYCEYMNMSAGATVDLELLAGEIDLQASSFASLVKIRGLALTDKKPNATKVEILTCKPGLFGPESGFNGQLSGGLSLSGLADVTIRNNLLAGTEVRLERIAKLDLDGCRIETETTRLLAQHYKGFERTKIKSCDFAAGSIHLFAPAEADKRLELTFDHCWFRGLTDPAAILREVVTDARRDSTCGILAAFTKIAPRPLGLGDAPFR